MQARIVKVSGPNGEVFELDMTNETVRGPGGWKVDTRTLAQSDVHVAAALPNFAAGFGRNQDQAIADIICPPVLVGKPSGKYHEWSSNDLFNTVTDDEVSGDAEIKTVSPTLSNSTYSCVDRGLASFVNNNIVMAADAAIDPAMASVRRVLNAMNIRREIRTAALALDNATTFLSYKTTLGATAKWNGGSASDPVANIFTAMETMYKPCTHIGMSERTWHSMILNAQVQKLSMYKEAPTIANPAEIAARLGLEGVKFVIGRMKHKSPTAGTIGYTWGNDVICLHIPPGADSDEEEIPTIRTFRWAAPGSVQGWEVREWDVPGKGQRGGRMIAVVTSEVQQAVSAATGHLIVGAYQ